MNLVYALATALLCGTGLFMMLSHHLVRIVLGLSLLSASVNLLILQAGRLGPVQPALVPDGAELVVAGSANPVPQALVLTAIVIGLALVVLLAAIVVTAASRLGSLDSRRLDAGASRRDTDEP